MTKELSAREALDRAGQLRDVMGVKGVNERRIAIFWGLFTLIFFSLFNVLLLKTAGIIITIAAVVGALITFSYVFSTRTKVRAIRSKSQATHLIRFWILVTPWSAGLFALGMLSERLTWNIPAVFIIAGVLSAIPMLLYRIPPK